MRVCWFTSSYPRWEGDGAGIYVYSLAKHLAALGYELEVIAPWDQALKPIDTGAVRVHRYRYAPTDALHLMGHGRSLQADRRLKATVPFLVPSYVRNALALARQLHSVKPFALIHGHWSVPGGFIAALEAKRTRLPYLITLHGSDAFLTSNNRLYASAAGRAFQHASFVTAVSQHLLDRSRAAGLGPSKMVVTPCASIQSALVAAMDGQCVNGWGLIRRPR